jgi:hypothetical protein
MESLREYYKYASELDNFHTIFYEFWKAGSPIFTDEIPTAAVSFDREGRFLKFLFNENFWNKLTKYDRLFVICHEMLHIILDHGARSKDEPNKMASNVALDLVVNHMLVNEFGFRRDNLTIEKDLCWVDRVFDLNKDEYKNISMYSRSYEFYLNEIKKISEEIEIDSIDIHEVSFSQSQGVSEKEIEEIKENISSSLSNETKKEVSRIIKKDAKQTRKDNEENPGTDSNGEWLKVTVKKNIKRKWETVIKKWTKFSDKDKYEEQWLRRDRRFESLGTHLFLPMEQKIEKRRSKIDVWFFQDTSGSCTHSAARFFQVARSIPEDRFNVKMFCFDTKIYPTCLKTGKLYGFGGTQFDIIESYIQQESVQKGLKYPSAVFIITDGYGNKVNPELPERWHWFLLEKESKTNTYCIPEKCKIYSVEDFE